jgi:Uma2 family endonuclease
MAMPAQHTEWTVDMVRALPDDGNRYEVIDGELFVTPAPNVFHQRAVRELLFLLAPYVRANGIGEALMAPADVVVYGPRKFVQPDVFVVPLVNDAPMRAWTDVGRLLLTAEVLSPSTERTDRGRKRILYKEKAVPEYWVVDTDARTVERYRPDDSFEILTGSLEWRPITTPLRSDRSYRLLRSRARHRVTRPASRIESARSPSNEGPISRVGSQVLRPPRLVVRREAR